MNLTREQLRALDRRAIEEFGVPGVVLMENAGRNAANAIGHVLKQRNRPVDDATIAVFCGSGNNAGDGYVVARHLLVRGATVVCYAVKPINRLKGDSLTNATIWQKLCPEGYIEGLPENTPNSSRYDVMVDAMLGNAYAGDEIREPIASGIRMLNSIKPALKVSLDVPSGLNMNTGQPADPTVKADLTITFMAKKPGFDEKIAQPYLGQVMVAGIGVPLSLASA